MLDDVLELAGVAREILLHQHRQHLVRDPDHVLALQPVEPADKVIDEEGNVLASFTEAWELEPNDVDAVEKIFAERAVLDQLREIPMGRDHDADVGLDRLDPAQRLVDPFLQNPQQTHLHRRRDVADLVEEDRAALGDREAPRLVALGVGEGARLVAEELGLEEGVGERAAVDGHEGLSLPRREIVKGPREELLAGAAGAVDHHRAVARRHRRQQTEQIPHDAAATDDVTERKPAFELLLQLFDLAEIAECLDAAHDMALLIAQNGGRDPHRHLARLRVEDHDRLVDDRFTRAHGVAQCTPGTADAGSKNVAAPGADRLVPAESR